MWVTQDLLTLAGDFPEPDREEWLAAVDKVLRGRDFSHVLESTTRDGLTIRPLYTAEDWVQSSADDLPGPGRLRRGAVRERAAGWDVRQRHLWGEATTLNEAILTDLENGVTSIELVVGPGEDLSQLGRILDGVLLDLAPVALSSAGPGITAAQALLDVVEDRNITASALVADLGCDPLGSAASAGVVSGIEESIADVADMGRRATEKYPKIRTFVADGSVYGAAGATVAHELALVASTSLTYVRALTDAGLDETTAFSQVLPVVSMDTDQFAGMAKIRALRVIWGRIAQASGAEQALLQFAARMSPSVVAERDPWTNLLRGTICCFSAAVAGADIITLEPFDSAIGAPDELGLRLARNTQLALMEESNIHRVVDPAGGSWFIESLTDDLAALAWSRFQDLERAGGVGAGLASGSIQVEIAASVGTTNDEIARRTRPIIGVSEFPDLDQERLSRQPTPRVVAAEEPEVSPVVSSRLAEAYETLRDSADRAEPAPTVFLASLGPAAANAARTAWARNFFEVGGLRAVSYGDFDSSEALVDAHKADGSLVAVLCGSDEVYRSLGAEAAEALKSSGVLRLYLAGNPHELLDELAAAGVDEFIYNGVDVVESLQRAQGVLGLEPGENE